MTLLNTIQRESLETFIGYRFNKHNFLLIAAYLRPIIARAANHAGLNLVQQLALALRFMPLVNSRTVQVSPCTLP